MSSNGHGTFVGPVARGVPFDNLTDGFVSLNVQTAIEESTIIAYLGSGVDGDLVLSSGTFNLPRTMYYKSVTLSGTAVVNTNGYKLFVQNTLSIAGTATLQNLGVAGGAASGATAGVGAAAAPGVEVGAGQGGVGGGNGGGSGAGAVGGTSGAVTGYGAAAGTGGGPIGAYTYVPEQVVRMDHFAGQGQFKAGGQGGSGGSGGTGSLLATGGGGGGSGSGGGVVWFACRTLSNTSSVGIRAHGGVGGLGGTAPSGNSNGGRGGGGGGGGMIYGITLDAVIGTIDVSGGLGGLGGGPAGTGTTGVAGTAGSTGHYAIYSARTGSWTVL
jgi:hypothetical protein